jgi:hypothetical protein
LKKDTVKTDSKAIRELIKSRLETEYPHFCRLKRKRKREIVKELCDAAMKAMAAQELDIPVMSKEERVGPGPMPKGIMNLEEMARFIENQRRTVLPLPSPSRVRYITDPLLVVMDKIFENSVLDALPAPEGMSPAKRTWMPSRLFRIEMLRTALFPEFSVRKFCKVMESLERKQERAFCNLSLVRKEMCAHSVLCEFRSGLTFEQRVNLMVYMAHLFLSSGRLGERVMHMVDSTDVATPVNPSPLHKIKLPDGTAIRFYSDPDCDCGSRRNKRDKSKMFVGYRVHTLCVADMETGIAFPLFSLTVAANHHDSQLLEPLLSIAQTVGLDVKLLSADEAYADAARQTRLLEKNNIRVVTPKKAKVDAPENVSPKTGVVFCSGACENPMKWCGYDREDGGHVFTCGDDGNTCLQAPLCKRERVIPIDTGFFGPLPNCISDTQTAVDTRKIAERPFNLLKHMDGLEPCRMKIQSTVSAQVVFSQMIGIFKVMAELRSLPENGDIAKQEVLPFGATG